MRQIQVETLPLRKSFGLGTPSSQVCGIPKLKAIAAHSGRNRAFLILAFRVLEHIRRLSLRLTVPKSGSWHRISMGLLASLLC